MKIVKPQETILTCDICGKKIVDYVNYNNNIRCIIVRNKLKRFKRLFSFFHKEMVDSTDYGITYKYRELDLCGECYDKMIIWVKNEINHNKPADSKV